MKDGTEWNGLKRKPIQRKPMKTGSRVVRTKGSTLVTRKPLARSSKPIPARSAKRKKFMKEVRVPLVKSRLGDGKLCDRCNSATAVDVHELLPRSRGGSMTDPNNLRDLCRPCHTWVTDHPRLAEAEGFRRFRWKTYDD